MNAEVSWHFAIEFRYSACARSVVPWLCITREMAAKSGKTRRVKPVPVQHGSATGLGA